MQIILHRMRLHCVKKDNTVHVHVKLLRKYIAGIRRRCVKDIAENSFALEKYKTHYIVSLKICNVKNIYNIYTLCIFIIAPLFAHICASGDVRVILKVGYTVRTIWQRERNNPCDNNLRIFGT